MMNLFPKTHIDFLKYRKVYFSLFGAVLVLGVICFFAKGFNMGIDFTGGTMVQVQFNAPVDMAQVRSALTATGANSELQSYGDNTFSISEKSTEQEVGVVTVDLFTPFESEYDNLPFIIVTKNKISAPVTDNPLASQLDIAPTVLDLLNIEPPQAFFGHSLFDTKATRSVFDIKEDYAVITTEKEKLVVSLTSSREEDAPLLRLMRTFKILYNKN